MSRLSLGVGNTQINGAGAALQARWPRGITDGGDATAPAKFGAQEYNGFGLIAYGGPGQQTLISAGAAAVDFQSTAGAPGGGFGVQYAKTLSWYTERTGGSLLDGWSCWSIRSTFASDNPAGAFQMDCGLFITAPNQNQVLGNGVVQTLPGVVFGPANAQHIALRARAVNGAALTVNDGVAAGLTPDITKYNTYELQIFSGSAASDPVLIALINGVQVLGPYAWTAAAALLPGPGAIAGWPGYKAGVVNNANANVANLYVHELCLTAGQTAADVL